MAERPVFGLVGDDRRDEVLGAQVDPGLQPVSERGVERLLLVTVAALLSHLDDDDRVGPVDPQPGVLDVDADQGLGELSEQTD